MKNLLKGILSATALLMGSYAMAQQTISLPRPDMKAHPTNPVGGCADANPKLLPNDT